MTASIARVKSAKVDRRTHRALAVAPAGAALPERGGHRDHPKGSRDRAITAVLPGCALRPSAVAALADGRRSGGFTLEATVAARHANTTGPVWV